MPGAHLFVYGTLRAGFVPASLAARLPALRRLGSATWHGRLYDLGRYPGAVAHAAAHDRVTGELVEVVDADAGLAWLDRYEGYDPRDLAGSLFVRERARVVLRESGEGADCWIYRYNGPVDAFPRIDSGDWSRRRKPAKPARSEP